MSNCDIHSFFSGQGGCDTERKETKWVDKKLKNGKIITKRNLTKRKENI